MIPEEKVREVAERLSIVEVISDYVALRRSGANFLGLCPFHGEKTPSFNVNPAREIFHCFGCGTGGNLFSFIMKIEGVAFPEAVKLLARRAGVEIEERQLTPAERQAQDERLQFQRINELAAGYYQAILEQKSEGAVAREYLKKRGVDSEIAAAYRLGFAPDKSDGLAKHLKASGASLDAAIKLGILRKGDYGVRDLQRNRLIFPIRDAKGQVIAFAGRVLDDSLPKYINSPESPLYHKSSVLFGLDLALPAIRTENAVIIVEGYFDHLALFKAGIRNAVATCGTALTALHAGLIKRHASRVYMLFDSDSAGQKATVRSMELFLGQKLPAYVISLPLGDDPDSYLSLHSVEKFCECQKKAYPAFEYFFRSLLAQYPPENVDSKMRVIDELLPRFRMISDPVERELYEKEICRVLGITIHAFRKRMAGMKLTESDSSPGVPPKPVAHIPADATQEMLLSLMVRYPEALERVRADRKHDVLFTEEYLIIVRALLSAPLDDEGRPLLRDIPLLQESPSQGLLSRLLIADSHLDDMNWQTAFDQCLMKREKQAIKGIRSIASRLASLDPASCEYHELLQSADALRTKKSRLQS